MEQQLNSTARASRVLHCYEATFVNGQRVFVRRVLTTVGR